jgi:DNA-binding IclR family transcriptional regulator
MVTLTQKSAVLQPEKVTGSIAHATDILVCLADDIHKVSDIARRTGFSKSTVHRVLKLMEQSHLAVQDTINRRYYLGPMISRLASSAITTHKRLITCADAEMKRLAYLSGETVVLDIMMGLRYLPIHEITSQQNLKVTRDIRKFELVYDRHYAGGSVKVLLSQLDDKKLCTLIKILKIPAVTNRTVTDKRVLLAQIAEIRKLGYTVSRSELIQDTICLAVPVFRYNLPVSLCVVGPEIRLQPRIREVVFELKASSLRISKNIADIFGERKRYDSRLLVHS